MEVLSREALKRAGHKGYINGGAPVKVLQFGEGNFLRAFADMFIDICNEKAGYEGSCLLVQPTGRHPETGRAINAQDGLYTVRLRGNEGGTRVDEARVISSVKGCIDPYTPEGYAALAEAAVLPELELIISNTTEAGIRFDPECGRYDTPPASFPAKLTQVLLMRFEAGLGGVTVIPCELIDDNAGELLRCIDEYIKLWGLSAEFGTYVHEECRFCSSLVDRIVTGPVRDEALRRRFEEEQGYADALTVIAEPFAMWVIQGDAALRDALPFERAGLGDIITVVSDITPYKKRKVRLLNGAHTGFVPGAYLAGFDIVRDCMHDDVISRFMRKLLYDEVIPYLPLDRAGLEAFAASVRDRFDNPFVDHALLSISLNSTSKWKARDLPSLKDYVRHSGSLPACLVMSFAMYMAFYTSDARALTDKGMVCRRANGDEYTVNDDGSVLEFFYARRNDTPEALTRAVMTNGAFWGEDLTSIPGFEAAAAKDLRLIREQGALAAFEACLKEETRA